MLCLHATQHWPIRSHSLSAFASGREHRGLSPPQEHCKKLLHKYQRLLHASSKELDAMGSQASEGPEMCTPRNHGHPDQGVYCSLHKFATTISSKVPGFQQVCLLCVHLILTLGFSCELNLALESRCKVPQDSACHYADQQWSPFYKRLYRLTEIAKECSNNIVNRSVLDSRIDTVILLFETRIFYHSISYIFSLGSL